MNSTAELIKPETVERLAIVAAANGFHSIDEFVEQQFSDLSAEKDQGKLFYETATPEEWEKAFLKWVESHDPNLPPLSLEDVSRESIYEDRW